MLEAATTSIWALTGIVNKLLDDFVLDNNFLESKPFLKTLLIGATFVFYTIGTFADINAMIFLYSICVIAAIIKSADYTHPIILSVFCLIPIAILYSYIYSNVNISLKLPSFTNIGLIILLIGFYIIDCILIRSEVSILKILTRISFLFYPIVLYFLKDKLQVSSSVYNIYVFTGAYAITSIVFQIYALYNGLELEKEEKSNAEKFIESLLEKVLPSIHR